MDSARTRSSLALAVASTLLASGMCLAARPYYVTDLGTLSGGQSFDPKGINNNSQVVGAADNATGFSRPVIWQAGTITDLTTLTGGTSGEALGINDAGRIVGWSNVTSGDEHATYWQAGTGTKVDLNTTGLGGTYSHATAVNAAGLIVGEATIAAGTLQAFSSTGGAMTNLNPIVAGAGYTQSWATGVNSSGQVSAAGHATPDTINSFVINTVGGTFAPVPSGGGQQTNALGINASGQVVGNMVLADLSDRGFLWTGGASVTPTATFGGASSKSSAINTAGDFVGFADKADSTRVAFIQKSGSAASLDLNTLINDASWQLSSATAINDNGQIVGNGVHTVNSVLQFHGFLLTPARLGDANNDGSVDGSDVALWAQNFTGALGQNPPNPSDWAQGDFNGDGSVDGSDVALWAQNFTGALGAQPIAPPGAASIGISVEVPEPASLSVLLLAGGLMMRRRQR